MKKVLIVDDSKFWRLVVSDIVKNIKKDVEILLAEGGMDGLQKALNHRPDYFIIDYNMPDFSGLYLSVVLREMKAFKDSGIVILTASSDTINPFWAKKSGANLFINKGKKEEIEKELQVFLNTPYESLKNYESSESGNVFHIVEKRLKREILEKEILSYLRYSRDERYVISLLAVLFRNFSLFGSFRALLLSTSEGRIYSFGEPVDKEVLRKFLISKLEKPTSPSFWSFHGVFGEGSISDDNISAVVKDDGTELGVVLFEDVENPFLLRNALEDSLSSLMVLFRNLNDFRDYVIASETDGLTGLFNKRAIMRFLEEVLRSGKNIAVAMMDIDDFKKINDTFGHPVGDEVLRAVANILRETVKSGKVGRYGGEEFMVVFETGERDAVVKTMNSIMENIRNFDWQKIFGSEKKVTLSGGVAFSKKESSPVELIEEADKKLYTAKRSGKDRYVI
ncbi:MAG: Response regulator receiver modulated diguanylate cyclase [Thermotoga petrophila]|uniref:Response regulator receiver modulated diguanylate cyclase n=1 Tax=Thermotoga petrophila TaxID=93929 RepID=A0A101ERF7_9THEM|nr:MAG: Response regulator receiver modulated diguanylate cyclase [Thermotoga petrophila]